MLSRRLETRDLGLATCNHSDAESGKLWKTRPIRRSTTGKGEQSRLNAKLSGSQWINSREFSLKNTNLNTGNSDIDSTRLLTWIRRAKKGDIEAFRQIYEAFTRRVLNFIYRMVNAPEEAEDLTQETFVAVYQKLKTLKDDSKFEPWLFRIARNFVYQKYRTRPPATLSIDVLDEDGQPITQLPDTRKNPDETFQAQELEDVVEKVIDGLPLKYREVLVLSALQHLSYQQIAEIVGRSLPSVKTDIHRARLEVRKLIKEYLKA
jgi:RNA polymerase sigma-70 factor (ECF subfamily)